MAHDQQQQQQQQTEQQAQHARAAALVWGDGEIDDTDPALEPALQAPAPVVAALPAFDPTRQDWEGVQHITGIPVHVQPAADVQFWVEQVQFMLRCLREPHGLSWVPEQRDAFMSLMQRTLRPPESFTGGQLMQYVQVWELLRAAVPADQRQCFDLVIPWLRTGIPMFFCDAHDAQKAREPDHDKKLRGLKAALREAGLTYAQAEAALTGAYPQAIVFGNRLAEVWCIDFARQQVAKAVQAKVVVRWPWPHCRPWVVLPLSVAVDAYGKKRLILDARYVNAFLQYLGFKYEQLADLPCFTAAGDFIITDDLLSGYHHCRQHADTWGLLGFELDGKLYCFTCLPFGLSQAPWAFTQVQRCSHNNASLQLCRALVDLVCLRNSMKLQSCDALWQ